MMNSADILDVAALLALRVDAQSSHPLEQSLDTTIEVQDALALLIEQWHWSLSVSACSTTAPLGMPEADGRQPVREDSRWPSTTDDARQRAETVTEILCAELLCRVYSVLMIARGSTAHDNRMKSLVDQISTSIDDMARFAKQHFILAKPDFSWSLKLYRLQKRLDRWSDILLAPILKHSRLERFWINRAHAEDWSQHPWNHMADRDMASLLLRRAIQSAVPADACIPASRSRHVERLLAATLMLIPDSDFTSDGVLMSTAQCRSAAVSPNSRPVGSTWVRPDR